MRPDASDVVGKSAQGDKLYFQCLQHVEFRDTDAAGIAHFSVFFNWMERAEHQMLRLRNWSVVHNIGQQTLSWPRVNTDCDFRKPLKFEQVFGVQLHVKKLGRTSATYGFEFLAAEDVLTLQLSDEQQQVLRTDGKVDQQSWFQQREAAAVGTITAVCCQVEHGKRPKPVEIPQVLRTHLEQLIH